MIGYLLLVFSIIISVSSNEESSGLIIRNYNADTEPPENSDAIEILKIVNSSISEIPHKIFHDFPNLKEILIEGQNLSVLTSFPGLAGNLISVDLENNKITEINSNVFENLRELRKLLLSRNEIGFLDQKSFVGLEKLEVLNLKKNNLDKIMKNTFEPLKSLKKLDLAFNRLQNVENLFHTVGFPDLEFLNLRNNKIKNFDFCTTEKLKSLDELILTNNKLMAISLSDCPANVIALNHNELITLSLKKTKHLYVLENPIKNLIIHEFQGYEVISDLRHSINFDRIELIRFVEKTGSADQIMSEKFGQIAAILVHFDILELKSWRASVKNLPAGFMAVDFMRR